MKIISLLSGGMDSATMLYRLVNKEHEVVALSFDYKQRHIKELEAAKATCEKLGVEHIILDLPKWHSKSALSSANNPMPEGHYAAENMKQTVVANRNMIFLSLAIGIAADRGFDAVAYGAHSGDHLIYPDCRAEFIKAMRKAARLCGFKPIKILAPYVRGNKITILAEGIKLKVDYSLTRTCYTELDKPCDKCGACRERAEAFEKNGIKDPLLGEM